MQLIPRYYIPNRVILVSNEAGLVTEFRQVYTRQLQVYKGIDNIIQFRLLNADQKPVDVTGYVPRFVAFDENSNLVIEHEGQVIDDSGTANKGMFSITISEQDLHDIGQQYLRYNVYLVDYENNKTLTYSHSNFDNAASIFVSENAFPGPRDSLVAKNFYLENSGSDNWHSESVTPTSAVNGKNRMYSIAFYTDDYDGYIDIQATLDEQASSGTVWSTVDRVYFTGCEEEPVSVNVAGIFSKIRFKTTQDPKDYIKKILVR